MNYHYLLILLIVCAGPIRISSGQDTLSLGLTDAIVRALDVSPEVAAVDEQRAFATARHRFAQANRFLTDVRITTLHTFAPGLNIPDPTVPTDELYLDPDVRNDWAGLRPFNRFELELRQPIYTWGELGGSIRAARHGVDVERASVRETEAEVALRTAELYQGFLLARSLLRLTVDAESVLEQARRELERLLDEGDPSVDDADLFRLQLAEQDFIAQVVEVTEQVATARTALRRQLMLPDEIVVDAPTDALKPLAAPSDSLDFYQRLATDNRPVLEQAAAGIAARSALLEVARSDYFPKLFLAGTGVLGLAEGRYRQRNPFVSDPFLGRSVGAALGLRQNLNFAQTRAQVQQAQAQLNEVRYQETAARQLVSFEVEEVFRQMTIAEARLLTRERSLTIGREWLRTEQINFDLGFGDAQNLIAAVQSALELEAAHLEAIRNHNVSVLRLLNATGILVSHVRTAGFL